jgi:nucleotide-binding universal stress UspA family protein
MSEPSPEPEERTFLVVVDNSDELHVALRFASLRAKKTGGRVALLYVVEPADFQHWMAVEDLMREEGRQEAEAVLQKYSAEVQEWSGKTPVFYLRDGKLHDELLKLIDEDRSISVLVLGAATGTEGPGPLISSLAGKMTSDLRIPLTIVPGYLTDEQLQNLT